MRTRFALMAKSVAALALAVSAVPSTAVADPVRISSGAIFVHRQDNASLRFAGTGLQFSGGMGGFLSGVDSYDPPYGCGFGQGCAGQTFNLSMSDSLQRQPPSSESHNVQGSFTTGGAEYWIDTFDYAIVAGDIVAPADASASTWFRFSAIATGTTLGGAALTVSLIGNGTAVSHWDAGDGWISTMYNFSDAAPVPEPASMLLLGSGLAGLAALRRRRPLRRS